MVYPCSSFPPDNYDLTMIEQLSCLCVKITCISFVISIAHLNSIAKWSYVLFQPILQTIYIFTCTYLALLIFGKRSLLEENKANSLFKNGYSITWEQAFTTFGSIVVLTGGIQCGVILQYRFMNRIGSIPCVNLDYIGYFFYISLFITCT